MTDDITPPSQRDRLIAVTLGLLALSVYLFTASFAFHSIDEIAVFTVGRSLASRGSFDGDILFWTRDALGRGSIVADGADGHTYVVKDVAPALLITPLIWLAHRVGISPIRASLIFGPLVTALTVALLYHVIRSWGYRRGVAVLGALTFAFASMAWPYAETLFTQSLAALGLLIALHGTIRAREGHGWQAAALGGLGLGLAGISAVPTWISFPVYLLYLLPWNKLTFRGWPSAAYQSLPSLIGFAAGAGLFAVMQGAYNLLRFGSPLQTGYQQVGASGIRLSYLFTGFFGLLLSAPRGVIWYAPIVLLIPFGLWVGWRGEHRARLILAVIQVGVILLLYSSYATWWAGVSWGPRFLVAVMPALVLLMVPFFDMLAGSQFGIAHLAAGGVGSVSFITQLLAVLFDYLETEAAISHRLMEITPPQALFERDPILWSLSALPWSRQLAALREGAWDVFWMGQGRIDWLVVGPGIILILSCILLLPYLLTAPWIASRRLMPAAYAAMATAFTALILFRYPQGPYTVTGMDALVETLSQQVARDDAILSQLPVSYLDWIDSYDSAAHDIGVVMEHPLSDRTAAKLTQLSRQYRRVWLVTEGTVSGNPVNGVESQLAQYGFIGLETWIEGFRIVPYTFSNDLSLHSVERSFGDGTIRLERAGAERVDEVDRSMWIDVVLQWSTSASLTRSLTVFVHLLNEQGALVAQHDGLPAAGYAPTTSWEPGHIIQDRHSVTLPVDLAAGEYHLVVGLYDTNTGERLALPDGTDAALLKTFHID